MTERTSKPRKGLTATLGIAIAAALSPSGKIISSAVAGAVAVSVTGTAIHENKVPPRQIHASVAASGTPAYQRDAGPLPRVYTEIESEGHTVHVLLTTGAGASGSHGSAASPMVTGAPIGEAGNPSNGLPGVGPTFGGPRPRPDAPVSPLPQPVPPNAKPPVHKEVDCRLEENKQLKGCEVKEKESVDDETDKDASNPSTHPNNEAAGPDKGSKLPLSNPLEEGSGTPPEQEQPQLNEPLLNEPLLEKLISDEFDSGEVTPPGETEPKIPEGNGSTADDQAEQALSFNTRELSPTSVPEPSLISLMFLGVAAMAWTGRRRTVKPTRV
ncbi:MAG: PEP-CTERM sorting domain-containing protein [Thiobacillus sp.]